MQIFDLIVPQGNEPERLDQFVARSLADITRAAVQRLIDEGLVVVDGKPQKGSLKLRGGETVRVEVPPPKPALPQAEEIPLTVVYEDSDLIVVDKSAGMVVHQGAGNYGGTLVNALLAHCGDLSGVGGEIRPGIVHRIDKDTSGLLVAAKNDRAHQGLAEQFARHSIKRIYEALVYGSPREDRGKIESLIGRHPTDRTKMSGKVRSGKRAVTRWEATARYEGVTLMRLRLETGRTHQIRVHLSEAGHPLLGDPVYDGGRLAGVRDTQLKKLITDLGRQALHARTLGFVHPVTGEYREFESQLPADMQHIIDYLAERAA